MSQPLTSRVERDLAGRSPDDAMNGLARQLVAWLHDDEWIAAALAVPSRERRAALAAAGAAAFDRDWGGYASFLRETTAGLDYIWTAHERHQILRHHVQWLLVNLSDILDFRYAPRDVCWEGVAIRGGEHLRAALAAGRGAIVFSAHQSHPGFGFLHPAWSGLGTSTVANLGDRSAPHTSLLLDGLRDRVELLPATAAALRPMLSRLNGGGCVAIYADFLYPGTPGVLSALFGGAVLIASAAVALAVRTGAAVIPVGIARSWPPESDRVQVQFGAPLSLASDDARGAQARDAAALQLGIATECLIRRNPEVWRLWASLADRWDRASDSMALARPEA